MASQQSITLLLKKLQKLFSGKEKLLRELQQKKKIYQEFEGRLPNPTIWQAFFIPSHQGVLKAQEEEIGKLFRPSVVHLKKKTLSILYDVEYLKRFSTITNPLDIMSQHAALLVLEVIAQLDDFSKKTLQEQKDTWIEIADNFGLWKMRYFIEDRTFALLDPENHQLVSSVLKRTAHIDKKTFKAIVDIIQYHFEKNGLQAQIIYRRKNTAGIFKKMQKKAKNINHIMDLFAFRIIVETADQCYEALNILHHLWRHFPNRFKDYIKHPKKNQYQSIHTTLYCIEGNIVEFQIRTKEMDYVAKIGPAQHAAYKREKNEKKG